MKKNREGWNFVRNVILKAGVLFVLLNVGFAIIYPRDFLGSISGYNLIFPGRPRLPHSDVPEQAFNITTLNLEAMFQSHVISAGERDEFRVAMMGDSSVWGFLLQPDQNFTAKLNQAELKAGNGQSVQFYNLGYPTLSVTKDLLLLDQALCYEPDMIIWFVTLESMVRKTQLESPVLSLNPLEFRALVDTYNLELQSEMEVPPPPSFWERTIVGSREELSELIRLQLYGISWAATGVDHYIPETYNERREDLTSELEYKGFQRGELTAENLYFKAFDASFDHMGGIPILIVNEPIFISAGENSDLRYNFFYPRWAYDQYRSILRERAQTKAWAMLDLWDAVPAEEFTDSAIHYSETGSAIVADRLMGFLVKEFDFAH